MWEKDKQLLFQYRECVKAFMQNVKDSPGEDIDWESACVEEGEKLQRYTFDMLRLYEEKNPMQVPEDQQLLWAPKVPYFQNL